MIEIVDTQPRLDVDEAEYVRLLGYPPGWTLDGRAAELASWARGWYEAHGRPWMFGRVLEPRALENGGLALDGTRFTPSRLEERMRRADAHAAVLLAVSAGPQLEAEAQRLWHDERPDEYFFLEIFGSAVVEHLVTAAGARLCAWAESNGMAVLAHDSPGYAGWDVAEQPALLALLRASHDLPGSLTALDSGALAPKKSQLALFGLTKHVDRVQQLATLVPCHGCALAGCQYRRRPYRRAGVRAAGRAESGARRDQVLRANGPYRTGSKALQRWARERLSLAPREDGGIDAVFRYDGTTCTNMGRELTFYYTVTLGPRDAGYPILGQHCAAAPGETGHTAMCGYIRDRDDLMAAIAGERPLAGRPLDDVLSWPRSASAAGCYCEPASREHKWGLVLETIHFALAARERVGTGDETLG
jgi:hypothetical protein